MPPETELRRSFHPKSLPRLKGWLLSLRAMRQHKAPFLCDEGGSTAIEYSMIGMAIAMLLIAVMPGLASQITVPFASLAIHIVTGK